MQQDHQPKTKEVDGKEYPASESPTCLIRKNLPPGSSRFFDAHHVGGALAAMTSDYRGNPVEIPERDRKAVMEKIMARRDELEKGRR